MRIGAKKIAWVVTAAAAAAMVTGSAVYASSNDAAPAAVDVVQAEPSVRDLLLPAANHPAGDIIEFSLADMVKQGLFAPPAGVSYTPTNCVNYLEMAIPNFTSLDGWVQLSHIRFDPDSWGTPEQHQQFFVNFAVNVPGGVDMDAIRDAALACGNGSVALESKVFGSVSYTEVDAPDLAGASTLGLQTRVAFPAATDRHSADLLAQYGFGNGATAADDTKQVELVGTDSTLYMVLSSDPQFGKEIATALYERSVQLKG